MEDRLYNIFDTYYTFEMNSDKKAAMDEIKTALKKDPENIIKMLLDIIDDLQE